MCKTLHRHAETHDFTLRSTYDEVPRRGGDPLILQISWTLLDSNRQPALTNNAENYKYITEMIDNIVGAVNITSPGLHLS